MELDRAREIIKALADGVYPHTGERIPADGPYQRGDIRFPASTRAGQAVRVLQAALKALNKVKTERPKDPTNLPAVAPRRRREPKASAAWIAKEQEVKEAFRSKTPIANIAHQLGRTYGAISARLVKLGLIDPNIVSSPGQGNAPPTPNPPRVDDEETLYLIRPFQMVAASSAEFARAQPHRIYGHSLTLGGRCFLPF